LLRSPRWSFTILSFAAALAACTGIEGDILRTPPDAAPHDATPADGGGPSEEPEPLSTWQIQLSGSLDTSVDVRVFTLDLDTPPPVLDALRDAGRIVFCYFSAGTMEPFRDDASDFPESSLGARLPDYPDERWVDVRDPAVRSIMQDRIARAAEVGCDGVHPSGLAGFSAENGIDFERADQLAYDRWLSGVAHEQGLSIGLVETDVELSEELVADFDWSVVWSCLDTDCEAAAPFVALGKAAFLVEYGDESRTAEVCPKARALGLSAIIKRNADLDAFRAGCF
jgi:hypothetical protein